MRTIVLDDGILNEAGDWIDFLVSEELGVKWPNDSVSFADWKDNEAMIEGGVEQGMKGAEVVILFDGSDCYIVASMADAIPL